MHYCKPELALLGDATTVIRGNKNAGKEILDETQPLASGFELED